LASLSFTNLRVNIDENVHQIYLELTRGSVDQAEDVPFIKMPDLFVAAACIGASENRYKELYKKRDIFSADAFDTMSQIPVLIALAYKRIKELDELSKPRLILDICEGWANGGIHNLYEQIKTGQGLRPLYRLIDFIVDEAASS